MQLEEEKISFTLVTSTDPLNKLFKSDGSKESRGKMYDGNYLSVQIESIEHFFNGHNRLAENQAIALGKTEKDQGYITTSGKVSEGKIARTKDYFKFGKIAFLLLDYDPSKEGFTIDSPEHYVQVLRDIDPELIYCDIGVRYGSSYGIMKDGVMISDKKSLHAYIIVKNATNEKVTQYRDYLVSSAWAKGYGHIELSKTGSAMRRQVFDSAVFSPERLVFEAQPTLEVGITRLPINHYISKGRKK